MLSWFCVELNEQSILQVGCGVHVHIKDRPMERWHQGKQWLIDFSGQLFVSLNTGRISIKMLLLIFCLEETIYMYKMLLIYLCPTVNERLQAFNFHNICCSLNQRFSSTDLLNHSKKVL